MSVLFAGIIGGVWGLVFSKSFEVYDKAVNQENEQWLLNYPDYQSLQNQLQKYKRFLKYLLPVFIIEIVFLYFLG